VTLLIDTAVVTARERLDFWSAASADAYHVLQVRSRSREQFDARMWGDELGPLWFFRIAATANTMSRTAQAIAAGDPECLYFSILLHGRLSVAQHGRTAVLGPGDIMSYDTSHPVVLRADHAFESLVLRLPRGVLGEDAARIRNLAAVRIAGSDALPRLAVPFLRGLADGLADGSIRPADAGNLTECVLDLVRGVYASCAAPEGRRSLRSRSELLLHPKAFIEANLGDDELDPDRIAQASFISTRYLHKLFESEGSSVCEWIRTLRLERCRRDLLDPALRDRTITTIASRWGLSSAPHFSRLFRAAYGCSPSELRRDGAATGLQPCRTSE
jgi:AraC-like DNA-binding protein